MTNFFTQFNWADYFIIAVIGVSTMISIARGFTKEAVSLFTWIVALFVGMKFSAQLADLGFVRELIDTPSLRHITAFAALFIAVLLIGGMLNFLINAVISKTGLGGFNRLVGMVFGFVRGVLLVAVLILLAKHTALPQDPWWSQTKLIPKFEPLANRINSMMPVSLKLQRTRVVQQVAKKG